MKYEAVWERCPNFKEGIMEINRKEDILFLTKEWAGERFEDGRPKVSDGLLERLKNVTTEEAVMAMLSKGYKHQFEGDLKSIHSEIRLVGRAVTAILVPTRPDVHMNMLEKGRTQDGRHGFFNQWVIETLVERDVLVVDMCDQILYGTYVGGNLSTAIKTRTKSGGAVIWGGIRDLEQIVKIPDFQIYYRGVDPTPIGDVMMTGMNMPCRIGHAVCLPGDVVLGTVSGVTFIPAHLAEFVACTAEKAHIKDVFGFERLASKTYTPSQIDNAWNEAIMDDFMNWLATSDAAKNYRHLTWEKEMEEAKNPGKKREFNGLVGYSYC